MPCSQDEDFGAKQHFALSWRCDPDQLSDLITPFRQNSGSAASFCDGHPSVLRFIEGHINRLQLATDSAFVIVLKTISSCPPARLLT